jgi:hypothetical protein
MPFYKKTLIILKRSPNSFTNCDDGWNVRSLMRLRQPEFKKPLNFKENNIPNSKKKLTKIPANK